MGIGHEQGSITKLPNYPNHQITEGKKFRTEGTEITDIFVTKRTWNAFYNTPLHEELKKRNITGIVLAGIATSIGVEGTARAAHELGYNISFATDAMTDRMAEAHKHSMQIIFPRIGELGTAADIIEKLNSRV